MGFMRIKLEGDFEGRPRKATSKSDFEERLRRATLTEMDGGGFEPCDDLQPDLELELARGAGCDSRDQWDSAHVYGHSRERAQGNDLGDATTELVSNG